MVLALGGRPDADKQENEYYINEFEKTSKEVKEKLGVQRDNLAERNEIIATFSYQSNERLMID